MFLFFIQSYIPFKWLITLVNERYIILCAAEGPGDRARERMSMRYYLCIYLYNLSPPVWFQVCSFAFLWFFLFSSIRQKSWPRLVWYTWNCSGKPVLPTRSPLHHSLLFFNFLYVHRGVAPKQYYVFPKKGFFSGDRKKIICVRDERFDVYFLL